MNQLTAPINLEEAEIVQDEDYYDDTMNRILHAENQIACMKEKIENLTKDRKELETTLKICRVPGNFIDLPFEKVNVSYSNIKSEFHHDFALFMAARIGDDIAVTHALQENKELNYSNDRITMAETKCKYLIDFIPFHTTRQTALHVGYHNLEIIDTKEIPTHGGSIRVYAARKGIFSISNNVSKQLQKEKKYLNKKSFLNFKKKVVTSKINLFNIRLH